MSQPSDSPLSSPLMLRRTQECDARLAADPEPHDKQSCERNFRVQLKYEEIGVITKRIHKQT